MAIAASASTNSIATIVEPQEAPVVGELAAGSAQDRSTRPSPPLQYASTSEIASANASGASCGRLCPTPPEMVRGSYLPENLAA